MLRRSTDIREELPSGKEQEVIYHVDNTLISTIQSRVNTLDTVDNILAQTFCTSALKLISVVVF